VAARRVVVARRYYGSQIVQAALLNVTAGGDSAPSHNATTDGGGGGGDDNLSDGHTVVLVTAAFAFMNFVFTLLGIYLADRCSRRRQTLSSLVLVVCTLVGSGVAFFLSETYVALAGCGLYLAAFACVLLYASTLPCSVPMVLCCCVLSCFRAFVLSCFRAFVISCFRACMHAGVQTRARSLLPGTGSTCVYRS
jgi:MFS family permease